MAEMTQDEARARVEQMIDGLDRTIATVSTGAYRDVRLDAAALRLLLSAGERTCVTCAYQRVVANQDCEDCGAGVGRPLTRDADGFYRAVFGCVLHQRPSERKIGRCATCGQPVYAITGSAAEWRTCLHQPKEPQR